MSSNRIKVGNYLHVDSNHWIFREEINKYVYTAINLVGGQITRSAKTLKRALGEVDSLNKEMIALGRPE